MQRSYGYGWDIQPDQLDVPAGWPPEASKIRKKPAAVARGMYSHVSVQFLVDVQVGEQFTNMARGKPWAEPKSS